ISSNRVCYDHIRIVWSAIPDVTKYMVCMLNEQGEWIDIEETIQHNYIYKGAKAGQEYYFSVKPVFGDFVGVRANSLKVTGRNNNTCAFNFKDVAVSSVTPVNGAIGSEYALTNEEHLTFRVINYGGS